MTCKRTPNRAMVWLAIGLLPSAALGWRTFVPAPPDRATGPMSFSQPRHDFGRVSRGERLEHRFVFTNRTDQPLRITATRTSCGCMASRASGQAVLPGQRAEIRVVLKTHGQRVPSTLEKTVWVEGDAGGRRVTARLTVRADLRPEIAVEPGELVFERSAGGRTDRCELTVRRELLSVERFHGVRLVRLPSYYRLEELSRTDDQWRIAVHLDRDRAPTYPQSVEVAYRSRSGRRTARVPVRRVDSTAGVRLVPNSYFVRVDLGGDPADLRSTTTRTLQLRTREGGRLEIDRVELKETATSGFFGWKVAEDDRTQLRIWLDRIPTGKPVVIAGLVILYHDSRTGTSGRATCNAYALVKGTNRGRVSASKISNACRLLMEFGQGTWDRLPACRILAVDLSAARTTYPWPPRMVAEVARPGLDFVRLRTSSGPRSQDPRGLARGSSQSLTLSHARTVRA